MTAPQGIVRWGKIKDFISAQMTFAPGISPSKCKIIVPPQEIGGMQSGSLTFSYGGKDWRLYKCRLDSVVETTSTKGAIVWELNILDRRWVWRECGRISGFYNARNGGKIRQGTEKSAKDLAELCLKAMGEKRWDLGTFAADTIGLLPEADWDYTNPAEALADICEKAGYLIVLGLDDQVHLHPKGSGKALPGLDPIDGSEVYDPPDPPGQVVVVGGRTRFQVDFDLEPVGLETDGSVKHINKLSYATRYGGRKWAYFDAEHLAGLPESQERNLAQATVYRWYRIKPPFTLPDPMRGEITVDDPEITSLDRILPLETTQVERWTDPETGIEQPRPHWVYGSFHDGNEGCAAQFEKPDPDIETAPQNLYAGHSQLDVERGIVQFQQPVYKLTEVPTSVAPGGYLIEPADIRLRVACNLRDEKTMGWVREEWAAVPPVKSSVLKSIRYVLREDVVREIYIDYGGVVGAVDNLKEITPLADKYLAALMLDYKPKDSASMTYAGLQKIEPDGAILQVSWIVAPNGRATTRVSRNREEEHIAPGQDEMRVFERLFREFREKQKPARQQADDAFHRRAPL